MKTKLIRVGEEFNEELKSFAKKNGISLTQASREFAKFLKINKAKKNKIQKEITF